MKRISLLLLTVCLLTILGCAGTQVVTDKKMGEEKYQVAGKYINPLTASIYLDLKDDGTFYDAFGRKGLSGKYVVNENRVMFTLETGREFECTIDGNSLITSDGFRYTKK